MARAEAVRSHRTDATLTFNWRQDTQDTQERQQGQYMQYAGQEGSVEGMLSSDAHYTHFI